VQIGCSSDGRPLEHRQARAGAVPVYRVVWTFLLNGLLADFHDGRIRFAASEDSRRAFAQLEALETECRESGTAYPLFPWVGRGRT